MCTLQGVAGFEGIPGFPALIDLASRQIKHRPVRQREPFPTPYYFGFVFWGNSRHIAVFVPFWFLLLLTGSLSAVLWRKPSWRFSLLSLFIAMTFLAVLLGMSARLVLPAVGKIPFFDLPRPASYMIVLAIRDPCQRTMHCARHPSVSRCDRDRFQLATPQAPTPCSSRNSQPRSTYRQLAASQ
jgi:hypothetical protein